MKLINNYISEKLIINANSQKKTYSDEELMNDYNEVWGAITKTEKKTIADKYGISIIKIKDIQLHILDLLRENRHKKNPKDFTIDDILNFNRFDVPKTVYKKFSEYLDKEPIEFVEFMKQYVNDKIEKDPRLKKNRYNPNRYSSYVSSLADRNLLKWYENLEKYLNENK